MMSKRVVLTMLLALTITACDEAPPPVDAKPGLNIDTSRITVSGVSSGAYMAGQYHMAYSSQVSGAGLIAGGPYWCAKGSISEGLGACTKGGDIDVGLLLEYANSEAAKGAIDDLKNLKDDRVWVFHGANDNIVHLDASTAAVEFYSQYVDASNISSVTDVDAPHGMTTVSYAGACETVESPFLNNCNYDAAGEMLRSIAGLSNPRAEQPEGELIGIAQPGASDAAMLDAALLFIPTECVTGESCGLHIAFHGCQQSSEYVDDLFASSAGFNEWATRNRLLVLYPQVAKSPLNPLGCWDWWGYTGANYATRNAAQLSVVKATVDSLDGVWD